MIGMAQPRPTDDETGSLIEFYNMESSQHWHDARNVQEMSNPSKFEELLTTMNDRIEDWGRKLDGFEDLKRRLEQIEATLHNLGPPLDSSGSTRSGVSWTLVSRLSQTLKELADLNQGNLVSLGGSSKKNEKANTRVPAQQMNILEEKIRIGISERSELQKQNQLVETQRRGLEEGYETRGKMIKSLKEKNRDSQSTIKIISKNLENMTARFQRLHEDYQTRGGNAEPLDSEIESRFIEIREIIQGIVHKYYNAKNDKHLACWESTRRKASNRQLDNSNNRGLIDIGEKRLLARSHIYRILHYELFTQMCFGLDDETEQALIGFEDRLTQTTESKLPGYKNKTVAYLCLVKEDDLIEWRTRTVIAAGKIPKSNSASLRLKESIKKHMDLADPPLADDANGEQFRQYLDTELLKLTEKAVSLKLLFRQNTTSYDCLGFSSGTPANDSDDSGMEIVKILDGDDSAPAEVFLTIHGGLIKVRRATATEEGSRVILVKAEVVCRVV